MSEGTDRGAGPSRPGFDALVSLSQDLLVAYRLEGQGQAAEAAARLALQQLPGVATVRVRWLGPQPGVTPPPLVTILAAGSAAPAIGTPWRGLEDVAAGLVREALEALAGASDDR